MIRAGIVRTIQRLLCALACLLVPLSVGATTIKDLKIGVHVIDFVTNLPTGRTGIGIAYDSRNRESLEDAQQILDTLLSPALHLPPGSRPLLIDIRDLDGSVPLRAVVVADRMKPYYDQLAEFGRTSRTLVISSDIECARAGKCTVGIASTPRVEVIVNTRQAQSSGIQFSEAFRMMVTEY